jgi:putative peptidoglycan lipid II flippase
MRSAGEPGPTAAETRAAAGHGGATRVAFGILLSRLVGLVRQRAFAHFFGNSLAADAFAFAFRIPNVLQNLLGDGVLSASFVPVYASLLAHEDDAEAGKVAGAVFSILATISAVLVLLGVLTASWIVAALAPGFHGETRELAVRLVRIVFPGVGLLVLAAWCLGVLNTHRRFFVAYAAPVAWNVALIVALLGWGGRTSQNDLAVIVAWSAVVGSFLQFAVQLPSVLRLAGALKLAVDFRNPHMRTVVGNFLPVVAGRGVVQISAWVDTAIASYVVAGAVSALTYAQLIYLLPVSLFGMSVSAAELPAMSSELGTESEVAIKLRARLDAALRRVAFLVIPSAVAFLALGDMVVGVIYLSGRFTQADAIWVWGIVTGSAIGLVTAVFGRLYASTFYALKDAKTPMRYAILRVSLSIVLATVLALWAPGALGIDAKWGVAGLTLGSGLAGWVEYAMLRRAIRARIGPTGAPIGLLLQLWLIAAVAAGVASLARGTLAAAPPLVRSLAGLGVFGVLYLGIAYAARITEAGVIFARLRRRASQ